MDKPTEDAVQEIEQIHSSWIGFEVAGEDQSLLALCTDDIELWPPDAQPVLGRVAVSAQLAQGTRRIYSIEISDRRIRRSKLCSTSRPPQCGQVVFSASCSAMRSFFVNVFLQASQKNS
jgi:hypothetical protein